MLNTIRYYYNFDDAHITNINKKTYIKYKNKLYLFCEVYNIQYVYEAYILTNNYPEFEKIILNKDKSIFTEYNNKKYVLIEKKSPENVFPSTRLITPNQQYLLDRTKWNVLWSKKIDYIEYNIKHIKGIYDSIDESIDYFIGMAETAINYFNYNIINNISERALCRRRMIQNEYYNPLNIIIDYKMRDVSEYLKQMFWTNNYNADKVNIILNKVENNSYNYKLLYARLLFPNYYFDAYEQIINNKSDQDIIRRIISRINEYEIYLNMIYNILKRNNKNLAKVDWI